MSRIVISKSGAHFRLDPQDATVIQRQAKHRARWLHFVTVQASGEHSAEAMARAWLAQLGHLQDEQPTQQEEARE